MKQKKKSSFAGKTNKDSQRQQSAGSSYGYLLLPKGVNVFAPEPGSKVTLDFMPYEVTDKRHPDRDTESEIAIEGTLWYKRPFKVHRNIGADKDTVVCLASFGKKCPICEYRAARQKDGADKEELDALKQSLRNLYVVIPLDSKKHEKKPSILDISQYLLQNLLNDELEENEDYGVFPDLEEGLSLKIRFDSATMGNSKPYAEASRIDFLERKTPYKESILTDIPNLDEVLKQYTYAELNIKFLELDQEEKDEEEEDADDKPRNKKSNKPETKPTSRKRPEPEPEEEEEEEEVDLAEAIKEINSIDDLVALMNDNTDVFDKATIKELKKIKKVKELRAAMLDILTNEEEEPEEEPEEEEEEEEEDTSLSWSDLETLNESKLKKLIKAEELDVDPDDFDDDVKALRKAIAKEMDIDIPRTGKKPAKEEDDDLPFKKGSKTAPAKKGDKAEPVKGKCPHKYVFGKDTDKHDECDSCKLWDDCIEAKEKK